MWFLLSSANINFQCINLCGKQQCDYLSTLFAAATVVTVINDDGADDKTDENDDDDGDDDDKKTILYWNKTSRLYHWIFTGFWCFITMTS